MKNKSLIITLIILLSIICVFLILFMVGVINKNIKITKVFTSYKQSNNLVINKTYDNDFEELNIDMDSGDVYVKESKDNKVKVLVYGEKENSSIKVNENKLSIESREKRCTFFCFNLTKTKIEVYLPYNYKNIINVNNNYGDIKIGDFLNANIKIESSCGDVLINGALNAKVNNDYGDISITKAKDINVKASAGDIKIGTSNNIIVKNSFGDVLIDNALSYINVEVDSGNVEIKNVNINKNSYIKNDYGDVEIDSTNDIYIDAKTDLGDVDVNHNSRMSDITLKIKNDCGDIEVDN